MKKKFLDAGLSFARRTSPQIDEYVIDLRYSDGDKRFRIEIVLNAEQFASFITSKYLDKITIEMIEREKLS